MLRGHEAILTVLQTINLNHLDRLRLFALPGCKLFALHRFNFICVAGSQIIWLNDQIICTCPQSNQIPGMQSNYSKMKLSDLIIERHSQENTASAVQMVLANKRLTGELIAFIFSDDKRLASRASWIASELSRLYPALIGRHMTDLVKNLENKNIDKAVKRNTLRIMQWVAIPPALQGLAKNICFGIIIDNSEPPAVKANALTVLDILSESYPEISHELKTSIEAGFDTESPAFKNRASKILKKLSKR